jgi:small subunit ribosomal protein S4
MGDIKRKQKEYSRPKQLFLRERIDLENVIVKRYGLKNKKEVWKVKSLVSKFRKRAKELISASSEDQRAFFEKLQKLGLNIIAISDALAIEETNLLDRRLQTFVCKKGFANSLKQSRQLIVHKHILVDGKIVNVPSFWVTRELENKIDIRPAKPSDLVLVDKGNVLEDSE